MNREGGELCYSDELNFADNLIYRDCEKLIAIEKYANFIKSPRIRKPIFYLEKNSHCIETLRFQRNNISRLILLRKAFNRCSLAQRSFQNIYIHIGCKTFRVGLLRIKPMICLPPSKDPNH